jgi:hypothetical protein
MEGMAMVVDRGVVSDCLGRLGIGTGELSGSDDMYD